MKKYGGYVILMFLAKMCDEYIIYGNLYFYLIRLGSYRIWV